MPLKTELCSRRSTDRMIPDRRAIFHTMNMAIGSMAPMTRGEDMSRDQMTGIVWVVLAIVYGSAVGLTGGDNRFITVGGAMLFAIVAVTLPIWRNWLPANGDDVRDRDVVRDRDETLR